MAGPRRFARALRFGGGIGSLVIVLHAIAPARAAESADERWFDAVGSRAWLANYDSTLIGRQLVSEFSYEDDKGSQSTTELDMTARDAWSPAKNLAVGLQAELPIKTVDTGGDVVAGAADFECRAGMVHRISRDLRWGAALNLKFPTASAPALQDAFELRPILAVSWDVSSRLNLGINAAYSVTPGTVGADAVSKLELKFPLAVELTPEWSAALTYKPTGNFAPASTDQKMELDVTRLFGDRHQFAVSPGVEVPLTPQSLEWKVLVALAWYF